MNEPIQIQEIAKDAGRVGKEISEALSRTLVDMQSVIEQVVIATIAGGHVLLEGCLLYTSPSPRDLSTSRMPSSA